MLLFSVVRIGFDLILKTKIKTHYYYNIFIIIIFVIILFSEKLRINIIKFYYFSHLFYIYVIIKLLYVYTRSYLYTQILKQFNDI